MNEHVVKIHEEVEQIKCDQYYFETAYQRNVEVNQINVINAILKQLLKDILMNIQK